MSSIIPFDITITIMHRSVASPFTDPRFDDCANAQLKHLLTSIVQATPAS